MMIFSTIWKYWRRKTLEKHVFFLCVPKTWKKKKGLKLLYQCADVIIYTEVSSEDF